MLPIKCLVWTGEKHLEKVMHMHLLTMVPYYYVTHFYSTPDNQKLEWLNGVKQELSSEILHSLAKQWCAYHFKYLI